MNRREQQVYDKLVRAGYEVYHKGYPDFIAYKGDKVIFVEVKRKQVRPTKKMGLSRHQRRVNTILSKLTNVYISYIK